MTTFDIANKIIILRNKELKPFFHFKKDSFNKRTVCAHRERQRTKRRERKVNLNTDTLE